MMEIKLTIEAGGVLAQALTAFIGGASTPTSAYKVPAKGKAEKDKEDVKETEAGVTLKALREIVTEKAAVKANRPLIAEIFEKFGATGASSTAAEDYEAVHALLAAL